MDWPIELIPLFGTLGTIFWILMLVHCWRNAKVQGNRTWWLLIIFFTHWIGAVAYFLVYVVPRHWWNRLFNVSTQPSPQPTSYYQPSRPQPTESPYVYQPTQLYEQGYQAQAPQSQYPSYLPVPSAMPQEEQVYSSSDYEQPQTMYPEMPPQQ